MPDLSVRAGDTGPFLVAVLRNEDGTPVDLTNALTAVLRMRRRDSTAFALTGASMLFASPRTLGKVSYAWQPTDTEVADIGAYWADVRVTWNDASTQSFPTPDFLSVEIVAGLASLPVVTDAQMAAIRAKVGTASPSDADIARSLARLGTTDAVILEVLEGRLADLMSAGSLTFNVSGEYSQDASKNAEWLLAEVKRLRGLVGETGVPVPWAGGLTYSEQDNRGPDDVGPYFVENLGGRASPSPSLPTGRR